MNILEAYMIQDMPAQAKLFTTSISAPTESEHRLTHVSLDHLFGLTRLSMSIYLPGEEQSLLGNRIIVGLYGAYSRLVSPDQDSRRSTLCHSILSWSHLGDRDSRQVYAHPERWSQASLPWFTCSSRNFTFPILILEVNWTIRESQSGDDPPNQPVPDLDIYITAMP